MIPVSDPFSESVFIIASHATDYEQVGALHNLCSKIKKCGGEYIISSHVKIPDHIANSARACIFDSRNKKIPVEGRDLSQRGVFFIQTSQFLIESPFFMHGGNPCYAQAHLDNVLNSLLCALRFGFKFAHFFTYDSAFEMEEILERESKLRFFDFVGFQNNNRIMGDAWSINLSKLNILELLQPSYLVEERISGIQHDDSVYIQKYLLADLRCDLTGFEHGDYRLGSEVTSRKAKKAEWALYYDSGINLFVQNITAEEIIVSVLNSSGTTTFRVHPSTYCCQKIYMENEFGPFVLKIDSDLLSSIDLSSEADRKYWVETTIFTKS